MSLHTGTRSIAIQLKAEPLTGAATIWIGTVEKDVQDQSIAKNLVHIEDIPQLIKALVDMVSGKEYQMMLGTIEQPNIIQVAANGAH